MCVNAGIYHSYNIAAKCLNAKLNKATTYLSQLRYPHGLELIYLAYLDHGNKLQGCVCVNVGLILRPEQDF